MVPRPFRAEHKFQIWLLFDGIIVQFYVSEIMLHIYLGNAHFREEERKFLTGTGQG